jgi:hypothetical protein
MKKWFEWQQKNQHRETSTENYILENIKTQCNYILSWMKENSDNFKEVFFYNQNDYAKKLSYSYPELSYNKIKDWVDDPEFDFLLKETAKFEELNVPWSIFLEFSKLCNGLFSIDYEGSEIVITKQKPGQTSPVHYDRRKHSDFKLSRDNENNVKRWLVMLEDQMPGQMFLMDNSYLSWKKGDIISWENTKLPHGAANIGFYDRYTLRITGKLVNSLPAV